MAPGPKGHLSALLALSLIHITLGNPLSPSGPSSFLLPTKWVGKVMGQGKQPQGRESGVPVFGPSSDLTTPGTL